MERFLIALDCQPDCVKILDYMVRVLKGVQDFEFTIFHIFATASPDKLRMEEVQRIEHLHATRPDLAGYFWKWEDEKNMERCFNQAREKLALGGFRRNLYYLCMPFNPVTSPKSSWPKPPNSGVLP